MTDQLDRLGRLARGVLPEVHPDPRLDAAAEALLVTRIARGEGRPRDASRVRRGAIAMIVAAAVAAVVLIAKPTRRLEYVVQGAPTTDSGYVRAPSRDTSVSFSDGSRIELAEGATARVADVTATGARVLVEDGRVDVRIAPGPSASWSFQAGPFAVLVTGTAFSLEWRARDQVLDLALVEGAVIVRGPMADAGVPLAAGHRLVADVNGHELRIAPLAGDPRAAAPTATSSAAASVVVAPSAEPDVGAPAPSAASSSSWSQRVAVGDFAGVLAEADARGISTVMGQASLPDLVALADAARYGGRNDVARHALLATRQRFAGTTQARTAAFLLGRMADTAGSTAAAVQWYDDYLVEAPSGSFAAEALGLKMLAVKRARGPDAARSVAEEYLRRFPKGGHAKAARQILDP